MLNLQIINEEDDLIYIPNTNVLSQDIINYTKAESLKVSIEFVAKANNMESIEALEQYFSNVFASNPNVEKDTFRLKVVHLKYKNIDFRAEANLVKRDSKSERQFKRQLVNAWFKYLQNAEDKTSH